MNRTRWRLLVACLAVIGAAIAVAGGSAGNRVPSGTFEAGSVTYGQTIAYTATFANVNKANLTHVEFRQLRPVAIFNGVAYPADFVQASASCADQLDDKGDSDPSNDELVCDLGELRTTDPPEEVVTVWQAPTIPSSTGCPSCLKSDALWLIKEGKPTNGNESFPFHVDSELIGNTGTEELLRASSYELPKSPTQCDESGFNLSTNQALNKDNPVWSAFCLPSFAADAIHPGVLTTITELKDNARQSTVCIAALGTKCSGPSYVAADFGPNVVIYVFKVFNPGLKGGPITAVKHNGETLTQATCDRAVNPECLLELSYDRSTQTWTIRASSETNGPFTW